MTKQQKLILAASLGALAGAAAAAYFIYKKKQCAGALAVDTDGDGVEDSVVIDVDGDGVADIAVSLEDAPEEKAEEEA